MTDVLIDVMLGVDADIMLAEAMIVVLATTVINSGFAEGVARDVDILTSARSPSTITDVTGIGVEVFAGMNVNGLATVMNALEFVLPAP